MNTVLRAIVAGCATLVLFVAPSLAQAAPGFIVSETALRAGPDEQFPSVNQMTAGAPVEVFGCLSGNSWCDVAFQQDRGWVSGQDLEIVYQNQRVKIVEVTTEVVPVVNFQVAIYWDQYYHDKPFYRDRDRFASLNININNGGKAAPGATGSGGQAAVTGGAGGKVTEGKTATGGEATQGGAQANANGECPAGQKNCKVQGNAGAGAMAKTGKAETGAAAQANAGCPTGQKNCKTQAAGGGKAMTGQEAGSMAAGKTGQGVAPMASAKNCKPGMANCPQAGGGSNGNGG